MAGQPLVSIITPSYNQAQYLEETIRSVLGQGYPNLEYLVVDGGSTDGSVDIIRRYADGISWWVSEPDQGQADAINKGLKRARGEVVAWLNSDDLYLPGAIRQAVDALQQNPAASMVYGDGVLVDAEKHILDWHRYPDLSTLDLMCWGVLLQPAVFMRRSMLEKAGYLDPEYHLILDHELWLRLSLEGPLVHVNAFWAGERTHPEAKTMAAAAGFVGEAEKLLSVFEKDLRYQEIVSAHRKKITASTHSFSGRRLIDSRQYRKALSHFRKVLGIRPAEALRYWYKVVQALMGALGFEPAFLWYRAARRRFQHRGKSLAWEGEQLRMES